MKRKTSTKNRKHKRRTQHRIKRTMRKHSRNHRRSTKNKRTRQRTRVIYHNGRRLKVHTFKGGNKFSNVPMSNGYSLGGIELAPENLNLANRPPHTAYKKCL